MYLSVQLILNFFFRKNTGVNFWNKIVSCQLTSFGIQLLVNCTQWSIGKRGINNKILDGALSVCSPSVTCTVSRRLFRLFTLDRDLGDVVYDRHRVQCSYQQTGGFSIYTYGIWYYLWYCQLSARTRGQSLIANHSGHRINTLWNCVIFIIYYTVISYKIIYMSVCLCVCLSVCLPVKIVKTSSTIMQFKREYKNVFVK